VPTIAAVNMRKVLSRVAAAEGVPVSQQDIEAAVAGSRGDVRHGVLTLQLQLVNRRRAAAAVRATCCR
jgi:DNA polymerase III delta prime subunit